MGGAFPRERRRRPGPRRSSTPRARTFPRERTRSPRRNRSGATTARTFPRGTRAATDSVAGPPDTGPETRAGATRHGDTREARRSPDPCPGPRPAASGSAVRGQAVLDEAGGIHVSAETARRLACDAATVRMPHGPGRRDPRRRPQDADHLAGPPPGPADTRPPVPVSGVPERSMRCAPRSALGGRRRNGARQPGAGCAAGTTGRCTRRGFASRWMQPATWSSSGRTAARCRRRRPRRPGPASLSRPVTAQLERDGVTIGPDTATPDWRGEKLDLDWVIHVLWRPRPQEATARRSKRLTSLDRDRRCGHRFLSRQERLNSRNSNCSGRSPTRAPMPAKAAAAKRNLASSERLPCSGAHGASPDGAGQPSPSVWTQAARTSWPAGTCRLVLAQPLARRQRSCARAPFRTSGSV